MLMVETQRQMWDIWNWSGSMGYL